MWIMSLLGLKIYSFCVFQNFIISSVILPLGSVRGSAQATYIILVFESINLVRA